MKLSAFWLCGFVFSTMAMLILGFVLTGFFEAPATDYLLMSIGFGTLAVACFLADMSFKMYPK